MNTHILTLTNELNSSNGWATVGYECCKYLQDISDLTILTLRNARNEPLSARIIPALSYQELPVTSLLRILPRLSFRRVDLVVCNVEEFFLLAFLLKLLLRSKLVVIGHGSFIYNSFRGSPKRTRLLQYADRLIVPSRYTRQKIQEFYSQPVEVIPWGVNLQRYFPMPHMEREQACIFVGELKERKGIRPVIQAFQQVGESVPEATLYMVGETRNYSHFFFSSEQTRQVVFTGKVSHQDLLSYYARAKVHILPSVNVQEDFEGFGLVHLEANACGLPTIGSLDCGNEDAIVNGKTGFLCPQEDVACLAQRMTTLLTDSELWERMSQQALEHARQNSWERVGEKLVESLL